MKFTAVVKLSGKTTTGIEVPDEVVEGLGDSKRPKVRATINGYTYRSSVARMGGVYMLSVSADVRANAGVAAGDELEVELQPDTEERTVTVPPDLAEALAADKTAATFFDGLSFSHKSWHVLRLDGAKKAETRQRRLEESVQMLREGRVP